MRRFTPLPLTLLISGLISASDVHHINDAFVALMKHGGRLEENGKIQRPGQIEELVGCSKGSGYFLKRIFYSDQYESEIDRYGGLLDWITVNKESAESDVRNATAVIDFNRKNAADLSSDEELYSGDWYEYECGVVALKQAPTEKLVAALLSSPTQTELELRLKTLKDHGIEYENLNAEEEKELENIFGVDGLKRRKEILKAFEVNRDVLNSQIKRILEMKNLIANMYAVTKELDERVKLPAKILEIKVDEVAIGESFDKVQQILQSLQLV